MKISAYNKEIGNDVILVTDYRNLFSEYIELPQDKDPDFDFLMLDDTSKKKFVRYYREQDITFDKIIISKVFTESQVPLQIKYLPICEYGGTGFFYDKAEPLPNEIEHHKPDYDLYIPWVEQMISKGKKRKEFEYYLDYSIGFTTRHCFRRCPFCVNQNFTKVELHSPLEEFLDQNKKYICLLDDNILGYPKWKEIINQLKATNKYFQYKQGMDERIMTEEKAEVLNSCKYRGDFIFAFDNIEDQELIKDKLSIWKKYCNKTTKLYVLCGFDRKEEYNNLFWKEDIIDTFERVKILMEYKCLPYIMRFKKYEESPFKGTYINLARWCNQPNFFKKKSYREFCLSHPENSATIRYMRELEEKYPEIAKAYFDLKYENKSACINKLSAELQNPDPYCKLGYTYGWAK